MNPVNEDELEWTETDTDHARYRRKKLGAAAGGDQLGCSLYELPPGATAFPYHYHTGNEEAIFVLAGKGRLRLDGETYTLEPGEYVACPANETGGHRIDNDGDAPLRYLVASTMNDPDVVVYPDSEKVGVFAGAPPGGEGARDVHGYYRREDDVDYWDRES